MKKDCPICGIHDSKNLRSFPFFTNFNEKVFEYLKCNNCNSIYLNNDLADEDLRIMYSQSYHSTFYSDNLKINNSIFIKFIENIINSKKGNIKVCDFGCGNCNKLNLFPKNFKKVGVEFSNLYIKSLKNKFTDISFYDETSFYKKKYHNYFDIIVISDVLEHLNNPFSHLLNLSKLIVKNGYFIIEGPIEENNNLVYFSSKFVGYLKKLFGKKNNFTPFHTFRTNHLSQKKFFNRLENFIIKNYYSYETGWPYANNGFLRHVIAKLNFIVYGKENKNKNNRFICLLQRVK